MRTPLLVAAIGFGLLCLSQPAGPASAQGQMPPPNPKIKIVYDPAPPKSANEIARNLLTEQQVLEKLQRFLSPLKLIKDLTIKATNCDGQLYVPYRSGDPATICYEYVVLIEKSAPPAPFVDTLGTAVVTYPLAVYGPFVQEALRNVALAAFDNLEIPVWGSAEFAADNVAAFLTLQFGSDIAAAMTVGSAYFLNKLHKSTTYTAGYLGDIRPTLRQRFYNTLCIVGGSDPVAFSSFFALNRAATVTDLPANMMNQCVYNHYKVKDAFEKAIAKPYIDSQLAKQVLATRWFW